MNNLGQWRTLQPQSTPVELGFLSNTSSTSAAASTTTTAAATTGNGASATGLGGVNGSSHNGFPRAGRQITKNPQTLFQNFPPCSGTSSNSATAMSSANFGGSVGFNSFANAGSNGAALLSPGGGGGTRPPLSMSGTLSGGANATNMGSHSFDFQLQSSTQQRNSPSFGCLGRNLGQFSSNASSSSSSTLRNGFDSQSRTSMINGFGQNGGGNLDRTMSVFDNLSSCSNNGFSRQMSMPSNLSEHNGDTSNGFARFSQNDFVYSNLNRGDNSPPSFVASSSIHEMKIGTWGEQAKPSMNAKPGGGMGAGGGGGNESFPQIGNFEIGTFQAPTSSGHLNRASYNEHSQPSSASTATPSFPAAHNVNFQGGGPGIRETGIIEKLLHSYGFIQCCDRQARLFFHFSQFDGNIEHLKIGDPVEFEMTYDRRTGKPIASLVSKIAPEVVLSEERVIGVVTTEAKSDSVTGQETPGRISYENRGECFFLPFNTSDVEGNVTLVSGHQVSFQVATMARSGNLVARAIRLENPSRPVKYQGVVNSIKESGKFGFIERSDVVREIFFHFTEVNEGEDICFGDDVEFTIQTRNGKEVACNISKLAPGTVVFEDVGKEYFRGQVLKPLDRAQKYGADGDALNGRIKYRAEDRSEVEVPFGEKDQVRDFTLKHGDWVKFVIAVDRRDKLQRATKIELLDESFQVSDERREQGTVHNLKDTCGYIKCAERDASILFYFSECLDPGNRTIAVGDECEFTVTTDPNQSSKLIATRIKRLTPGTVHFSVIIHRDVQGSVDVEPSTSASTSWPRSPTKSSSSNGCKTTNEAEGSSFSPDNAPGKILYELNGMSLEIPVFAKDYVGRSANSLRQGDIVLFDINQSKATKETNAVNVRSADAKQESLKERNHLGYIAALKDGFGFIETLSHEKEIFFHFSNLEGKAEKLEVGTEVEYTIYNPDKGGKMSAEGVRAVPKGTIPAVPVREEVLDGKVVRPLRSVNPDQDEYCGLIQVKSEEGEVLAEYKFGIASLANKKELLQVGDPVQFQIHVDGDFAGNVQATKEKLRALVEAMKGQFGFLSYEVEEGKKLFFHKSEVVGNELLQQGDEVEFVVVTNKRTGKHSACCVKKLSSSKRPERLISKLKNLNLEGKKIVVLRQPRGPDGSKGFQAPAV